MFIFLTRVHFSIDYIRSSHHQLHDIASSAVTQALVKISKKIEIHSEHLTQSKSQPFIMYTVEL